MAGKMIWQLLFDRK